MIGAVTLAIIGWALWLVFFILWVIANGDRDEARKTICHYQRCNEADRQDHKRYYARMQSAEHDLNQLLQMSRTIRVKRAKRDK